MYACKQIQYRAIVDEMGELVLGSALSATNMNRTESSTSEDTGGVNWGTERGCVA